MTYIHRRHATPAASPDAILRLGFGFWGSKVLLSAVELGVFTALAGTSVELEPLRVRLGLHPARQGTSWTPCSPSACWSARTAATPTPLPQRSSWGAYRGVVMCFGSQPYPDPS